MATKAWTARIRMGHSTEEVTVQAAHYTSARNILEAQYGKGSIISGPWGIRDGVGGGAFGPGGPMSGMGFRQTAISGIILAVGFGLFKFYDTSIRPRLEVASSTQSASPQNNPAVAAQSNPSPLAATANLKVGPSFDCAAPAVQDQPLAQLICLNADLARAQLSYVISFQAALRQTQTEPAWKDLLAGANAFMQKTADDCGIPRTGKLAPNVSSASQRCVMSAFGSERERLLQRTSGDARAEASLTPEQAQEIQSRLRDKGFLPSTATIDGVFGPVTREAIAQWQRAVGQPQTGFGSAQMLKRI